MPAKARPSEAARSSDRSRSATPRMSYSRKLVRGTSMVGLGLCAPTPRAVNLAAPGGPARFPGPATRALTFWLARDTSYTNILTTKRLSDGQRSAVRRESRDHHRCRQRARALARAAPREPRREGRRQRSGRQRVRRGQELGGGGQGGRGDQGGRRRGRGQLRLRRGRRQDRADGARLVRAHRHRRQQRRHPARHDVPQDDPGRLGPHLQGPRPRRVPRDARGVAAPARSRLRPHHLHGVGRGHLRQLRPGQLQHGEARPAGPVEHARPGRQEEGCPRQHHRSDRGLAPHGDGAAEGADRRAQARVREPAGRVALPRELPGDRRPLRARRRLLLEAPLGARRRARRCASDGR